MKLNLIIISLFFYSNFQAQTNAECEKNLDNLKINYKSKKFIKALDNLKIMMKCESNLTADIYYNAAVLGALANKDKLAIEYLEKSIKLGFNNFQKLKKDTLFNNIKNKQGYKNIILKFNEEYNYVAEKLKKLNVNNYDNYIPFNIENKWGWINKNNNSIVIDAILDKTFFTSGKGLPFIFNKQKYILNSKKTVILFNKNNESEISDLPIIPTSSKEIDNLILPGFKVNEDNQVIEYSDRFHYVKVLKHNNELIGITNNKDYTHSIIYGNGKRIKKFKFNFEKLNHFYFNNNEIGFIGKKVGESFYKIYDFKGNIIFNDEIESFNKNSTFNNNSGYPYSNLGSYNFIELQIRNKYKIFMISNKKLINSNGFNKVYFIDGPTKEIHNIFTSERYIYELYFLVSNDNEYFYIDLLGKEYRKK